MSLGLCVSPGVMPSKDVVDELNTAVLRSILYRPDDLLRLQALDRALFLTLNNEFSLVRGWDGWEDALQWIADNRKNVWAVSCGNELDTFWSRNRADVPPEFAADLVNRAQQILGPVGIKTATTSLAGPNWVEYGRRMLDACSPDYIDLHPYGWGYAGLDNKLSDLKAVAGDVGMVCSEVGVHISDAGGEEKQASLLRDAAHTLDDWGVEGMWFAWHDAVGAPWERGEMAFGLMAEDGRKRPAWDAYKEVQGWWPAPARTDVGWVGPGLQSELDRLGWTPTSPEHRSDDPLVWATTDDGADGVIVWDQENGRAVAYRRA